MWTASCERLKLAHASLLKPEKRGKKTKTEKQEIGASKQKDIAPNFDPEDTRETNGDGEENIRERKPDELQRNSNGWDERRAGTVW